MNEFHQYMDFSGLERELAKSGLQKKIIKDALGLGDHTMDRIIKGEKIPNVDTIFNICCFLGCGIGDVVKFSGYNIDNRLSDISSYPLKKGMSLTYEPFSDTVMFYHNLSLREALEKIEGIDMYDEAAERWDKNIMNGKEYKVTHTMGKKNVYKIARDDSVNFRIIYCMGKAFNLPVDCIVGGK